MPTGGPTDQDTLSEAQSIKFMRVIDAETGNVVQIQLIDTGLTTVDGQPVSTMGVGATSGINVIIVSKTIGEITAGGASGLEDFTNGGEFTGLVDRNFLIEIDLAAGTDTFKWSLDGGTTWEAENVAITGNDQTLQEDITIKWDATTGHTLAQTWTFTCLANDPAAIKKDVTRILFASPAPSASVDSDIFDARGITEATITIEGTFGAGSVAGMTVDLYASHDGINFDVDPWIEDLEPTFVTNSLARISHNIDLLPKYFKATLVNLDAGQGIGGAEINVTAVEKS